MRLEEGAMEDSPSRTARSGGGWREAFLNRHRKAGDGEEPLGTSSASRARGSSRSLSRPRASSRTPGGEAFAASGAASAAETFDQRAVLEQDRALIEQLTQRTDRRERSVVRKPPPPPKVAPYKSRAAGGASADTGTAPPSPSAANASLAGALATTPSERATPVPTEACATPHEAVSAREELASPAVASGPRPTEPHDSGLVTSAEHHESQQFRVAKEELAPATAAAAAAGSVLAAAPPAVEGAAVEPPVVPVVPRTGGLFTAADIDCIMDRLGGDGKEARRSDDKHVAAKAEPGQCTQNFGDISKEFFSSHRMEVTQKPAPAAEQAPARKPTSDEFEVPQRRALKEQIQAIDSWLEDDFSAREQLSEARPRGSAVAPSSTFGQATSLRDVLSAKSGPSSVAGGLEAEIFSKLEEVKRKKAHGERTSPVRLKEIATQAKPLLPNMTLEQLVSALRLFCSARYEDHDLYLRILGEIPVQVRGISPEMLTTCLRVLWRLRLYEETYLELFSMEAMNMIRAARRPTTRAPRRPPAPSRLVDTEATKAASSGLVPPPTPPPAPTPPEVLAPFSAKQLIHIGNSLSQLGAKHPARFMDVFQEQLSTAIPRFTQEECELVSPALATSQLMPDALRRAFLERCAQVDAGTLAPQMASAAPDIEQYQREADLQRRREKHFRNVFVLEASLRKETFSFFSSLSAEVRTYLDRVHAAAGSLKHEGTGQLATQVAAVLDQLGVSCDLTRMAGPLSLHVVSKATNPRAECKEVVYECSEIDAFCASRQDDKGAVPQHTTVTRLRHKLLQRLGIQLVQISVWEWNQMSEAQRVNYMVKLQSLQ
eukprot:gb/GFBE01046123.1/.p1 GENE.gb/GFBE01046123.1/~~gb/GFBE01046123.1/.p1  ORF type:complete len:830 (+),score=158.54 gb/GFBE01046123.1/:1-2490(+)